MRGAQGSSSAATASRALCQASTRRIRRPGSASDVTSAVTGSTCGRASRTAAGPAQALPVVTANDGWASSSSLVCQGPWLRRAWRPPPSVAQGCSGCRVRAGGRKRRISVMQRRRVSTESRGASIGSWWGVRGEGRDKTTRWQALALMARPCGWPGERVVHRLLRWRVLGAGRRRLCFDALSPGGRRCAVGPLSCAVALERSVALPCVLCTLLERGFGVPAASPLPAGLVSGVWGVLLRAVYISGCRRGVGGARKV